MKRIDSILPRVHMGLFTAIFALFHVVSTAAQDVNDNLLKNGDFTQSLSHWKIRFDAPTETKYGRNHEWITVERQVQGAPAAIRFTLTPAVAASEGVKASTPLIPLKPETAYEFGCRIRSQGPSAKVILEGYQRDPERTDDGADQIPGFKRIYRAVIHPKDISGEWSRHRRVIHPPTRYQPTHVLIKLYAYLGTGEIHFTDVYLEQAPETP